MACPISLLPASHAWLLLHWRFGRCARSIDEDDGLDYPGGDKAKELIQAAVKERGEGCAELKIDFGEEEEDDEDGEDDDDEDGEEEEEGKGEVEAARGTHVSGTTRRKAKAKGQPDDEEEDEDEEEEEESDEEKERATTEKKKGLFSRGLATLRRASGRKRGSE